MSHVVLFNPTSSPQSKAVMPLSLLAVGAMLEGLTDYEIVDGNLEDDAFGALESRIHAVDCDVLAMTVMPGPQLAQAVPLVKRLRQRFPALKIIWGGYFPTMHTEIVLQSGVVDFVVSGHSDWSVMPLINAIRAGNTTPAVPGVSYVGADGEIVTVPPGPVPDINQLPDFPYHRVEMSRYVRPTFMGERTLGHHASYGCPFRCNFCAVVNMVDGRYSAQTAERAATVTERLVKEFGADSIEYYDNNFFVSEARCREFAERIEPLGIGWWAYGRIDTMLKFSDRTWHALQRSGLRMVYLGAEAGSDDALLRMNKGGRQTAEQAVEIASRMKTFDIVPEMSFMLGNPPDPMDDAEKTMRFIRRVKKANPDVEVVLYIYAPVPSSGDLYSLAQESGFEFPSNLEAWAEARWIEFSQHRTSDLPWLSPQLRRRVHNFQRVLHAAYPTTTDRSLVGFRRLLLQAAGRWRYQLQFYDFPIELKLINRLFPYQRPDTAGF